MVDVRLLAAAVLAQAWRDVQYGRHKSVWRAAERWLPGPAKDDRRFWVPQPAWTMARSSRRPGGR